MNATTFKVKKALTRPTLKFQTDVPLYVKITGPMHLGATRGKQQLDSEGNPKKPPTVCDVIDLTTGEACQIICAEIIKTELSEAYPKDGYVGLGFALTKQKRKEGKRYDPYSIAEIELPAEYQTPPTADAAEAAKAADATKAAEASKVADVASRRR